LSARRPAALVALAVALGTSGAAAAADDAGERLKKVFEASPEPGFALDMLLEHYRTHRGGLEPLVAECRARAAAAPGAVGAWLALGYVLDASGDVAGAAVAFGEGAARSPKDPRPHYAEALAWRKLGDAVKARAAFEAARARLEGKHGWAETKLRTDTLRALGELALDGGDLAAARAAYGALVALDPGSAHLRFELPKALAARGRTAEAMAEYEAVARGAGRDGKTRVLAMKEIGALAEATGDLDRALETYRAAAKLLAPGHWLAGELEERIVDVYRKRDDLRGLAAWYEARGGALSARQLETLGGIYEELGRDDDAIGAWRKVLARKPAAVEVRVRLIAVYRRIGRVAELLAEYERLIRAAPDEPRWRLDWAAELHARGDRAKAMAALAGLGARWPRDASVRLALADLYTRWGERARAIAELEALRAIEPAEEGHRISLGELYWQGDDRARAVTEWTTLVDVLPDKVHAHVRVGEVLGEHGLVAEALVHFAAAERLRPADPAPSRARATLFEREKRWGEAAAAWEAALGLARKAAPPDEAALASAREHLIDAHDRAGTLLGAAVAWRAAFTGEPPDAEAGHLYGLALLKLGKPTEAARVLDEVARAHPDPGALAALEKLHAGAERWAEAIAVLERLAAAEPARARELYGRIADYYANLYDDAHALAYARKAVDLGPSDARAWERLGEIQLRMRDRTAALASYEKAAALAPRLFRLSFALADLYGDDPRADAVLVDVLRRAGDEADLLRAARSAIRHATTPERLAALETEVLALYHRPPPRKVFRSILVELYGDVIGPLWRASRDPVAGAAARALLRATGERALKPLVDALADEEALSRAVAADLLGELGNPGAALPLAHLLDEKDVGLKMRAAMALGRLGDLRGAPALARALSEPEAAVRMLAAWALGAIRSPNTVEYLSGREGSGTRDPKPPIRAIAALALGARGDPAAVKPLRGLLGDGQPIVRRAAAWALARLGARDAAPALRELLASSPDPLVRRAAAGALGRLGDGAALPALLAATWDGDAALRATAAAALGLLLGRPGPAAALPDVAPFRDTASARVDVEALVGAVERDLVAGADLAGATAVLLRDHGDTVVDAVRAALAGPSAAAVALDLDLFADRVSLGPLTVAAASGADGAAALAEPLRRLGEALAPVLADALPRASGGTRIRLADALGKTRSRAGTGPLVALRADADPDLREAVARALGRIADPASGATLAALATDPAWAVRAEALRALGALKVPAAARLCGAALAGDRYSVVQEAAALALAELGPAARAEGERLVAALRHEDAPVRAAAATALGATGDRAHVPALEAAATDPDAAVRAAAEGALGRLR